MENQTTEELLKECIAKAQVEHKANANLRRSLTAVLNRFFKSRENSRFLQSVESGEYGLVASAEMTASTKVADSKGNTYKVWDGGADLQKKTSTGTLNQRPAVGSGIEDVMKELGSKITTELESEEDEETESFDDPDQEETALSEGESSDPMLEMTVEEYMAMYGGLPGLKAFAKDTLGLKFAQNSSAEKVVSLIKHHIRNHA
jgi:hypothetical protein